MGGGKVYEVGLRFFLIYGWGVLTHWGGKNKGGVGEKIGLCFWDVH